MPSFFNPLLQALFHAGIEGFLFLEKFLQLLDDVYWQAYVSIYLCLRLAGVSPLGVGNESRRGAKMVNLLSALVGISKVDRGVLPSVLEVPLAAGV